MLIAKEWYMDLQEPRVIIFDIGNIFFTFESRCERIKNILRAYGGKEGEVWFSGLFKRDIISAIDSGRMTAHKLWKYICKKGGISHRKLPEQLFAGLYLDHLQRIPATIAVAQRVQQHHPLIAVSNGDMGSRYAIQLLTMPPHNITFLETYVSCEEKTHKPGLYAYVAEDLWKKHHIAVDQCVCVDDIRSHVDFVNELGMRGIIFNGATESAEILLQQLQQKGVQS
jgi:FMN phosphatase YigB (HAD superfamily)